MGLPISGKAPADQQRVHALYLTSPMSRGAVLTVEEYNKEIKKFQEELQAKIEAENTDILHKKLLGIDTNINTNLLDLKNAYKNIDSLKFWQYALNGYDKSLDAQINALKNKQELLQAKIKELEQGKKEGNKLNLWEENFFDFPSAGKSSGIYDNDVLKQGHRNILT